jgi:hypothetical protein
MGHLSHNGAVENATVRIGGTDSSAYARLKTEPAGQEWPDMNAYVAAKRPLIAEISTRAEGWAQATGCAVPA